MQKIVIKKWGCSISIGTGILEKSVDALKNTDSLFLMADEKVYKIYHKKITKIFGKKLKTLLLPAGEKTKQNSYLSKIYDFLLKEGANRKSILIAFGGGVIGDLVGFAAATFMRGITLVSIPTSLVAQVDSCIGGKTGINHPKAKNIIGAFKQPSLVCIDTEFLKSLSQRDWISGYAEIVKHALIQDKKFFEFLQKHPLKDLKEDNKLLVKTITRSCEIKLAVVKKDEKEKEQRAILNFGHSLAHLIETYTNYNSYLHGEAVFGGMDFALWFSKKYLKLKEKSYQKARKLLQVQNLHLKLKGIQQKTFCEILARDKKNFAEGIQFIAIPEIGKVKICKNVQISQLWEDFLEYSQDKNALVQTV